MSPDPRLEMYHQECSIYYEKPLHMLSQADKNKAIQRHLTSKTSCQRYIERLQFLEPQNLKSALNKMLTLCDVNNDELCIYILQEFHKTR